MNPQQITSALEKDATGAVTLVDPSTSTDTLVPPSTSTDTLVPPSTGSFMPFDPLFLVDRVTWTAEELRSLLWIDLFLTLHPSVGEEHGGAASEETTRSRIFWITLFAILKKDEEQDVIDSDEELLSEEDLPPVDQLIDSNQWSALVNPNEHVLCLPETSSSSSSSEEDEGIVGKVSAFLVVMLNWSPKHKDKKVFDNFGKRGGVIEMLELFGGCDSLTGKHMRQLWTCCRLLCKGIGESLGTVAHRLYAIQGGKFERDLYLEYLQPLFPILGEICYNQSLRLRGDDYGLKNLSVFFESMLERAGLYKLEDGYVNWKTVQVLAENVGDAFTIRVKEELNARAIEGGYMIFTNSMYMEKWRLDVIGRSTPAIRIGPNEDWIMGDAIFDELAKYPIKSTEAEGREAKTE